MKKALLMSDPSKGYVIIASRKKFFYKSAIYLIDSIKDFYPEAKCCLVTEERFLDGSEHIVDDLLFCDDHSRAKMDGMARSPYDLSFYIDADCEVVHEDIEHVFDELGEYDVMFTELTDDRRYCFKEVLFPAGKLTLCGGVCLYDLRKPIVREFMRDWYDLTVRQYAKTWWPAKENGARDYENYPESLSRWDQFSLWWLVNKEPKYKDLKVGIFNDDARWNHYSKYKMKHCKGPIVINHYSDTEVKQSV